MHNQWHNLRCYINTPFLCIKNGIMWVLEHYFLYNLFIYVITEG